MRALTDVLMYQPDFVVVDFSGNDKADAFFRKRMKALCVSCCNGNQNRPSFCSIIYFMIRAIALRNIIMSWERGTKFPMFSIKDTLYQQMKQGMYSREALSPDGLHPNDQGHRIVAKGITALLDKVKRSMQVAEEENRFPTPMTANAYENAKRQKKRPDIWTILKMDGLAANQAIKYRLKLMVHVLRFNIEKPFVAPHCALNWFWMATNRSRFYWMGILVRIGVTAFIWS